MATIGRGLPIFVQDRDLLERFRRGERDALARVYEHYVDEVAALARRGFSTESQGGRVFVPGLPDIDAQHDVIQETFVKALSDGARAAFDGVRPYRPFLLRIARNAMIDRFRARRREAAAGGDGVGDLDAIIEGNAPLPAGGDAPLDLDWKRRAEAAQAYLRGLDAASRELVRVRFEQELSQDAAADALGCSRRRVRTLEARVQRGLRRHLKRLGLM